MADPKLIPRKAQNLTERFLGAVALVLQQHWEPTVHAMLLERLHRDVWYRYLEKKLPYFASSPASVMVDFAHHFLLSVGGDLTDYHSPGNPLEVPKSKVASSRIDAVASGQNIIGSGDQ